jgi:Zn-dependent protease
MDRTTKRALWVVAGVVVFIALVLHHNITSDEIILFCVVVPSVILHEISHGWVARIFGDNTAARAGRLSLNPLVHVDPVGTLIVPAVMALAGYGVFGWAKPVPVNTANLRSPRNQGVLVSLAGPLTNLILAIIGAFLFIAFFRTTFNAAAFAGASPSVLSRVVLFFSVVNIGLMAFNLIPIPPLDGSVLFERALPARYWPGYLRIRPYTSFIVVGLVILNIYLSGNGHLGPLTWLIIHLYNWWLGVLHAAIRFG